MPNTKMIFTRDRTIKLQFDLHRIIMSGDTYYFAMKTDRKRDYYDIEPLLCTIVDTENGIVEVTITNDLTMNLETGMYYGEFMRLTAAGSYQTLQMYDIDLRPEIISTRDI